jgi:LacI family transcriptional regulator
MTLHGKNVSVFRANPKDQRSDRLVATLKAWLKKLPGPVGVFAANDRIAVAVVSACNLAGLSIPDDVAVIGVDNDEEICEGTHPTLSSVGIDFFAA